MYATHLPFATRHNTQHPPTTDTKRLENPVTTESS